MAEKLVFPALETERLYIRVLKESDAAAVFRHFADEAVTRYMDIPPCRDMAEASEIIRFHTEDSGCRWGLFDKATGQLAGTCGYHCWVKEAQSRAEIGYDLSSTWWSRGLMTEAITPVIRWGFEQMKLDLIEATIDPANERSARLLERLGFQRKKELVDGLVYYFLPKLLPGE
ncbi:GNAT family N-acetyltransferase [Paenibacillus sp. FSL R7-0345]|uniref:GNAT family N-acetyltransferase n=1 Tax=Paenibacillus sp. FSL R7-0345 TaxID=2954535 RepID=UPI003159C2A4